MKENKNIDRLFQERFKDFEKTPDSQVWNKIEESLKKEQITRKAAPFWLKISGIAASLLLLLTIGGYYILQQSGMGEGEQIVNTGNEKDLQSEEIDNFKANPVLDPSLITDNTEVDLNADSNISDSDTSDSPNYNHQDDPVDNDGDNGQTLKPGSKSNIATGKSNKNLSGTTSTNLAIQSKNKRSDNGRSVNRMANESVEGTSKALTSLYKKSSFLKKENAVLIKNASYVLDESLWAIQEINLPKIFVTELSSVFEVEELEPGKNANLSKWEIAPTISPVYFNSLGQGSPIDSQFKENSKTGDITMSYGIYGSYAINTKFKVRAGLNKVELGYSTNNVIVYGNVDSRLRAQNLNNLQVASQSLERSFLSASNISNTVLPNVLLTNPKGSLDQEMGYVELPIEAEYNVIDKRIDLNLIGGFSTFFLDKNEVYSDFGGSRVLMGKATNLNKTSFSANFGLGVNYNITERLDLSLEPTFKYQINTFDRNAGDFRPYFIGVYSGIRFKF